MKGTSCIIQICIERKESSIGRVTLRIFVLSRIVRNSFDQYHWPLSSTTHALITCVMATLPISFLFCMVLLLPLSTRSIPPVCLKTYCGSFERELLPIEFPFYLRGSNNESDRCGYPGFEVSCNDQKQALLTFQHGGEFVVTGISIEQQRVWINDPDECLPRRYLQNINLTDSPFQLDKSRDFENLLFLNCTKSEVEESSFDPLQRIACLSNDQFTIIYTMNSPFQWNLPRCHEIIGSALVPIIDHSQNLRRIWEGLHSDIILQWDKPLCGNCEADQRCGFSTDTGLDVSCYDDRNVPSGQGIYTYILSCLIIVYILHIWEKESIFFLSLFYQIHEHLMHRRYYK